MQNRSRPHAALSPRPAGPDTVVSIIARTRRRLLWTAAARAASVACPSAALAGAAATLTAGEPSAWWPLAAAAAAVPVAGAFALFRAPSLAAAASALDARLGLHDRAVAALQFRASKSPVATLVVRDAAVHLAGVSPRIVFPVGVPRASGALGVAAAIAVLWLSWGVAPPQDPAGSATGGAREAGAGQGAGRVTSRTGADASEGTRRDAASASAAPRETGQDNTQGRAGRSAGAADAGPAPDASATPTPGSDRMAERQDREPAAAGASARQGDTRAGSAAGPDRNAAANAPLDQTAGNQAQANTASPASAAQRPGTGGGRPGGAGGPERPGATGGAGGAAQGSLLADATAGLTAGPAPTSARLALARASAEAALARDTIPPELRDYVREYFRTLAPVNPR